MDDWSRLENLVPAARPAERVRGLRPKERAADRRDQRKGRDPDKGGMEAKTDEAGIPPGEAEVLRYDRLGLKAKPPPRLRVSI